MDPTNYPAFIDESMRQVPAIRSAILLYSQHGITAADLQLSRVSLLSMYETAAQLQLHEIRDTAAAILNEMVLFANGAGQDGGAVSRSLDLLSDLEALLLRKSLENDNFSLDIDGFVDSSFDLFLEIPKPGDPFPVEPIHDTNDFLSQEPLEILPETAGGDAWPSGDEFEVDHELLEIFGEEAEGLLKNIEASLASLANDANDRNSLWEIRRNAHTFKGSAGIVGLKQLSELAHRVEDLLDRLVETENGSNLRIFELLHTSTNCLKALTKGDNSPQLIQAIAQLHSDFDGIVASLNSEPEVVSTPVHAVAEMAPVKMEAAFHEPVQVHEIPVEEIFALVPDERASAKPQPPKSVVRVSLSRLDELVSIVRDMIISRSVLEQNLKTLDRQIDDLHNTTRRLQTTSTKLEVDFEASLMGSGTQLSNHSFGAGPMNGRDDFDELEFDQYTEFHQSTRELAETASDAFSINASLDSLRGSFESLLDEQRRLVDQLQEKLMRIRMVEFGSLSTRLQRAVRVTCEEESKKAQIHIENERLEIDTQILDSLIEPLTHLLKNAVVHGIEDPETRRLLGKPELGLIDVSISNEETHIVLTVTDDGRGISPSAIKDKALSMGSITWEEAEKMSDEEALELIFLPGLSTAEKLNLSAGRGVGMSIVRESIKSARGSISIDSEFQKGTTFTVKMPLALAVTKVLLVRTGERAYAMPMKQVTYVTELTDDLFAGIDGQKVDILGKRHPLIQLSAFLGNEPAAPAALLGKSAIVYESAERSCAIAVDEVIKTEEVVIKQLLRPLDQISGILGAAILGTGELVPILDVPALLKKRARSERLKSPPPPPPVARTVNVLIVDDSPSVRHMTSKVIQSAGWQVRTAKDGIDAIEQLKSSPDLPVVILSDIEMPRMDGYELAASLQRSPEFRSIPLIMITSRSADKHRERAMENGVSQYLTKPYQDNELISSIKALADLT